jgi:ketosteroid isomerase-like protein
MARQRPKKKTGSGGRGKGAGGKRTLVAAQTAKAAPRKRAIRVAALRSARQAPVPNPVRQLAQRLVDLTVKHEDEQAFAFYADDVESIEAGMPPAIGIEAIRQKFAMWRGMVSDSTWQARNVWVDGNAIMIEWSARVTFAATGKQVDLNEVAIHEI